MIRNGILVVEDEAVVAMDIEMRLSSLGYKVAGRAATGEQAIGLAAREYPELVLMDIHLAGDLDGIATAGEIRDRFRLPVIFLTAFAEEATLERAKQVEPFGYILKPFHDRELKSTIEIALYKHQTEAEIHRLNKIFNVFSRVTQSIAHIHKQDELLSDICSHIVELDDISIAWIGRMDPATGHTEKIVARAPQRQLKGSSDSHAYALSQEAVRSVAAGSPYVCSCHTESGCDMLAKQSPSRFGIRSCGAFPISFQGTIWGSLNVGVSDRDFFGERAIGLMKEITAEISFALEKIESESARRYAESELLASRNRLQALFDGARDAIFIVDVDDGFIMDANAEALRLVGRTKDELIGRPILELHPPEYSEPYMAAFREHRDGGRFLKEAEILKVGGEHIPVEVSARVVRFADGQQVLQCLFRDISERKRAEEVRKNKELLEEQLAKTASVLPGVLFSFRLLPTGEQRWEYVSPTISDLMGVAQQEVLADVQVGFDLVAPEDLPALRLSILESARTLKQWRHEFRLQNKTRHRFWIEGNATPQREPDGSVVWYGFYHDITDHKLAEIALAEETTRRRMLFDLSADGIVMVDDEGKVREANRRFSEMLGYPPEELMQLRVWDWDAHFAKEEFAEILANPDRLGRHFETIHRRKDGSLYSVLISATPIDWDGEVLRFCICHDIDERKAAEKSIMASANKLKSIFRAAPIGIGLARHNIMMEANDFLCALAGYAHHELLNRNMRMLFPSDEEYKRFSVEQMRQIEEDGTGVIETVFRSREGRAIDVLLCSSVLNTADRAEGVTFTVLDITEDKRLAAEKEMTLAQLRLSEETERALLDSIPEVVLLLDVNGRVLAANETAVRRSGFSRAELSSSSVFDRLDPDCAACRRGKLEEVIQNKDMVVFEDQHRGEVFLNTMTPIFGTDGKVARVAVYAVDITQARRSEEERERLRAQLGQAQKMEAIGQLAGGIAHDFNNMLSAVVGNAYMLSTLTPKHTRQSAFIEEIMASTDKAAALTRSLLTFGRRQMLEKQLLDINDVVGRSAKLLQRLIGEDIDIKVQLHDGPLLAVVDGVQIEQVLMNLSTNARDAMPDGGVLTIATEDVPATAAKKGSDTEGDFVCISVADTGEGMDEATVERIFEPFYTTKEIGKGTGLGLSMVFGIIEQHGGHITVESAVGRGTVFRIFLKKEDNTPGPLQRVGRSDVLEGGTESLLLVEDDADIRRVARSLLEQAGYKVFIAVDGHDAVEKFREHQHAVKLVIMDVVMPRMNGRLAYEQMRKVRNEVEVLFMSGYPADMTSRRGILEEGTNFLRKPASPAELLRRVREILDGH